MLEQTREPLPGVQLGRAGAVRRDVLPVLPCECFL
jgi:hypothetical protein